MVERLLPIDVQGSMGHLHPCNIALAHADGKGLHPDDIGLYKVLTALHHLRGCPVWQTPRHCSTDRTAKRFMTIGHMQQPLASRIQQLPMAHDNIESVVFVDRW